MKKMQLLIVVLFFSVAFEIFAQPTTSFRVILDSLPNPNLTSTYFATASNNTNETVINAGRRIVFSVWLKNTSGAPIEFSGGQIYYNFNKSILNGGTGTLNIIGSKLIGTSPGTGMWLKNPTVTTTTTPAQLRTAASTLPGAGGGLVIANGDSMLWARFKLVTSANVFAQSTFDLAVRVASSGNPYTKYGAYINGVGTAIENYGTYTNPENLPWGGHEPFIGVVKPSDGDEWHVGNSYLIKWSSFYINGSVKIELTTDNGENWQSIGDGNSGEFGRFIYNLPYYNNSSNCLVRIYNVIDTTVIGYCLGKFTISNSPSKTIRMTAPNSSVTWHPQTAQNISWNVVGGIDTVGLEYTTDGGANWSLIAARIPAQSGNYTWTIPLVESSSCHLRVFDITRLTISDINDSAFTISNSAPLPVELISFTAQAAHHQVDLQWATATESNTSGFAIERAACSKEDGAVKGEWEKIAFVNGAGSSVTRKEYNYNDTKKRYGKFLYRLKTIDNDGTFAYSSEVMADLGKPEQYALLQNYPNPFNPVTKINFEVPAAGNVTLMVYDILGNQVAMLFSGNAEPGAYMLEFNATSLPSGTYFYVLRAGTYSKTMKMMVLK
ncbi:MAG: T9SS type A sorting domain-containing protein [Ignavibacteriales bacterium]|nr:T9SS type A sorting domain-containing protein [Ignavibacteriales bacterium]